ncbi:zinc-binding dehydrogenase [Nonomuraea sp. NEAU-A123]|uniref:zinc-dependent alcohol dehydrogenase n=1 Tax=Nonomuraea sp. NEAU-A123 TaxID=2839649 RepID=UPI001BE3D126|nr:alcohol dehydrogenase catalytic domain-containing protein [Nonomuraea sp. NEAU-A123]MBT2225232.1 alcohol dehydrogenase catalytic domain-containing protein [Nonomuraea sp. NEAU-A123]
MRVVTWAGVDRLAQQETPIPEISDGEVLVRVSRVGICGSDLAILRGQHARAETGVILGHEFAGTVAESRAPGGPPVGSQVAVRPLIACADRGTVPPCRACASGNAHVCRSLGLYGVDEPGGLAEFVAVRAGAVHPVRQDVSPELTALAEPLAVAVHAVSRSGLTGGESVAVYGGGPIGLFTALVARHRGAADVVIVEPNAWRRGVAESFGFPVLDSGVDTPAAIRERTSGDGADIVFDSAGHPAVARQLTEAARIQGTIVIVGVYKSPPEVDLRTVNFAEHRLVGTRVYSRDDFATAVTLLENDDLALSGLPTRTFPVAEAADAFAAAGRGEGSVKVLIDPSQNGDDR